MPHVPHDPEAPEQYILEKPVPKCEDSSAGLAVGFGYLVVGYWVSPSSARRSPLKRSGNHKRGPPATSRNDDPARSPGLNIIDRQKNSYCRWHVAPCR